MVALPAARLTPEQYLELEAKNSSKHEYIDGRVCAMAGTTDTHNEQGLWVYRWEMAIAETFSLQSLNLSIPFSELYEDIAL